MKIFIKYLFIPIAALLTACDGNGGSTSVAPPDSETDIFGTLPEAETELYTYSNQIVPSLFFSVEVNGEEALVIPTAEHHVCTFGAAGPVAVKIRSYKERINEAAILPKSREYKYMVENDEVTVILSPGDRVVVELNGKEDCDLFIFVNPIEKDKPSETEKGVRYFKAGTVTDINTLTINSGETLYIEGGAVVKGCLRSGSGSSTTTDVSVRGCGILDSRGVDGRGIQFRGMENLLIEDITLLNDINWSTFISESRNVTIDNYKVVAVYNPKNDNGLENDALDILGCQDVLIKGCFGYAHDDVFCIKAHKWDYKGVTKNVVFDDCIAWNHTAGNSFVIGAETNEPISSVTYRNSVSIRSQGRETALYRGGLSVHHCAGGHISDILFENIVLEDCREFGIHLDIRKTSYEIGSGVTWTPGTCDGITLKNINILKKPPHGNVIMGYDSGEHKMKNIRFSGVVQEGTEITAENISRYIKLTNADINFE